MEEAFIAYMKNIAVGLKEIAHTSENEKFITIPSILDIENLVSKLRNLDAGFILIAESPEGRLTDFGVDNEFDIKRCAFVILKREEKDDLDNEKLFSDAMKVGKKVITRMKKDKRENIIHHFKVNVDYFKIGPIANGRYGYRYEFEWGLRITDLIYKNEDWL